MPCIYTLSLGVGAIPSRSGPISSSSSSSSTSPPNDSFPLSKLLEESTVKKLRKGGRDGERDEGKEAGRFKAILSQRLPTGNYVIIIQTAVAQILFISEDYRDFGTLFPL